MRGIARCQLIDYIDTIKTIKCCNKERPDENTIVDFLSKSYPVCIVTTLRQRIIYVENKNELLNKPHNGKNSYYLIDDSVIIPDNSALRDDPQSIRLFNSETPRKFNKSKNEENFKKFKQQRNHCVKLSRKTKMEYFNIMDVSKVNYNKMFWKTAKPRFQINARQQTIILTEGDTSIKNEKLIANTFNNHLSDVSKILKLEKHPNFESVSILLHKICENTGFH